MSNESSHTHGRLGSDLTTRALCIAQAVTSYDIKTCLLKHLDSEVRLPCVMNCIFLCCPLKFFLQSQKHQDLVTEKHRLLVFLCHHF